MDEKKRKKKKGGWVIKFNEKIIKNKSLFENILEITVIMYFKFEVKEEKTYNVKRGQIKWEIIKYVKNSACVYFKKRKNKNQNKKGGR